MDPNFSSIEKNCINTSFTQCFKTKVLMEHGTDPVTVYDRQNLNICRETFGKTTLVREHLMVDNTDTMQRVKTGNYRVCVEYLMSNIDIKYSV